MLVITVFQLAIIRQPFPELLKVFIDAALVVAGLMLFVRGLEMGLFSIGEALAIAFARIGSLAWLLIFGFGLIAFASLFPMITVMGYVQFVQWWARIRLKSTREE